MFRFEQVTLAYFVALGLAAPLSAATRRRVVQVILTTGAVCLFVLLMTAIASADVRSWLGHGYLVAGYWLPALLVPDERGKKFEAWLVRTDAAWRGNVVPLPPWSATVLELAYLLCYPAVPIAFAAVWIGASYADVDRFWVAVLASGFVSYGTLPWLVSRPPRAIDQGASSGHPLAGFNVAILRRVSHQLNTFPSGHVAVSLSAALCLLSVWRPMGVVMGIVAAGVAIGAVTGRYHYLVDVILGVAVALACTYLSMLV